MATHARSSWRVGWPRSDADRLRSLRHTGKRRGHFDCLPSGTDGFVHTPARSGAAGVVPVDTARLENFLQHVYGRSAQIPNIVERKSLGLRSTWRVGVFFRRLKQFMVFLPLQVGMQFRTSHS
ncbi:hypothetical protein LMG24235_04496 [Paraburkholderia sabiae]|nr:hypothetical protein LMG24235_04496 [Paraburkholderia sabiae]